MSWGFAAEAANFYASETWSLTEQDKHINELELQAIFRGLTLAFAQEAVFSGSNVLLYTDNTVTHSYVNNFGDRIRNLFCWTKKIWYLLSDYSLTLPAKF